jgi:hypothetical protein
VRVAGSAEIGGSRAQAPAALQTLYKVLHDWFPGAAQLANTGAAVQEWKGARPMLPDGPPILGATGVPGVWINLGHGSSGWALACGSARVVADLMGGNAPLWTSKAWASSACSAERPHNRRHAARHDGPALALVRRRGHPPHRAGRRWHRPAIPHVDAARRPGHRTPGAGGRPARAHGLDRLRARQQRRRRLRGRPAPGAVGQGGGRHLAGDPASLPDDASAFAGNASRDAGVRFATDIPQDWDLCIDALLGIGGHAAVARQLALDGEANAAAAVLAVDVPSRPGCRHRPGESVQARHTLACSRSSPACSPAAAAMRPARSGSTTWAWTPARRRRAPSSRHRRPLAPRACTLRTRAATATSPSSAARRAWLGAAQLAASAALHAGAGRVFLAPLDPAAPPSMPGSRS